MLKSSIPCYYLFHSRLKSNWEKISWFIIYLIPIYIIGLFYISSNYLTYSIIFAMATLIFNSIYEIGYIENDIRTIKNEKESTIRLNKEEYNHYEENYFFIMINKILIACVLLFLVKYISNLFSLDIYILQFVAVLIIIRSFFFLHNKIRSKANILTFFSLSLTKYSAALFLVLPFYDLLVAWVMSIILFPLVRTMEHATKQKYGLKRWINFVGDHDLFRIKYYGFMSITAFVVYLVTPNNIIIIELSLLIYFLLYRTGSFYLVKKKFYQCNSRRVQ